MARLNTAEVARILGIGAPRVRELVRAGVCRPVRSGRGYRFGFQDLVALRAAQELIAQKVPLAGVRRALQHLADDLPGSAPVAGLRLIADGRRVAIRSEGATWQPETGQTLFDFSIDDLAAELTAIEPRDTPSGTQRPEDVAEVAFDRAVEMELGGDPAAEEAYRRVVELDPEHIDARINLGRLRHEAGHPGEALPLYEEALALDPDDALLHFNLALALEDLQGIDAALKHYERALELDEELADAHYNLASLYERLDRGRDALRHYRRYKELQES